MGPWPGPDIGPGPQLELGGRKFELGPQFIRGPPVLETGGPTGPMPQGPGVLDPELPEGLLTKPWGPEPGPQGTRGGGGAGPPPPEGGPGEGPW